MNTIPTRSEAWKYKGSAGDFHVWHAGKNDYRVTDGSQGLVVATSDQFGLAHAAARRKHDLRSTPHVCVPWRGRGGDLGACLQCGKVVDPITNYYSDRANGAHAAKAP